MVRRLRKLLYAARQGLRYTIGPATPRDRWFNSLEGIASVHSSTAFNDLPPNDSLLNIGNASYFEPGVTIWLSSDSSATPHLSIGERVLIAQNCYLGSYKPISIGNDTQIGAYCYIISANHNFERRDVAIREQGFTGSAIEIGADVWIGAHVMILPGVVIGKGVIVGAGSVVTKSIPPYQIWAGNPAKYLKDRPGA